MSYRDSGYRRRPKYEIAAGAEIPKKNRSSGGHLRQHEGEFEHINCAVEHHLVNEQADGADGEDQQHLVPLAEAAATAKDEADAQNVIDVGGNQETECADGEVGQPGDLREQEE